MGLAGVIAFAGLNIQTYNRPTYERPVATVKFTAVPDQADAYRADVVFSDGQTLLQADGSEKLCAGPVALCRCGASANKPFCDGSHTRIGFKG